MPVLRRPVEPALLLAAFGSVAECYGGGGSLSDRLASSDKPNTA